MTLEPAESRSSDSSFPRIVRLLPTRFSRDPKAIRTTEITAAALLLCLGAALSWGIGNVLSRASGVAGGLSLTVWSALVVPVPALALSLLRWPEFS